MDWIDVGWSYWEAVIGVLLGVEYVVAVMERVVVSGKGLGYETSSRFGTRTFRYSSR